MSLSVDAHQALAAPPVPRAPSPDASGGQPAQHGADSPASPAAGSNPSAAYTIAPTASGGAAAASGPLPGVQHDLDSDGARLMALQVQQALAGQPASIANQSSQSILSLFRA